MSAERWAPIWEYLGYYEASNLGRVRSLPRTIRRSDGKIVHRQGKILTSARTTRGYQQVILSRDGEPRAHLVHLLVLTAFVGPRPRGLSGCFGSNGPADVALSNLYWGSPGQHAAVAS